MSKKSVIIIVVSVVILTALIIIYTQFITLNNSYYRSFKYNNIDDLQQYEEKSAYKIILKKLNSMEEDEIRYYLLKKGYREESIKSAFNQIN